MRWRGELQRWSRSLRIVRDAAGVLRCCAGYYCYLAPMKAELQGRLQEPEVWSATDMPRTGQGHEFSAVKGMKYTVRGLIWADPKMQ